MLAERFATVVSLVVSRPDVRLSDLKAGLQAADEIRRRSEQERRDAANYSRFRRIKPPARSV